MSLTADQRRILLRRPDGWLALGLGPGLVPKAPGTVASLVAVLPWLALRQLHWPVYLLILALAFAIGVWACGRAGRAIGVSDHGAMVWDEYVGQWLAWLPVLSASWSWVLAGFVLFRIFDIFKPWPIGWADRHYKGGLGVMLDDVLAGLAAALVLTVLMWLMH